MESFQREIPSVYDKSDPVTKAVIENVVNAMSGIDHQVPDQNQESSELQDKIVSFLSSDSAKDVELAVIDAESQNVTLGTKLNYLRDALGVKDDRSVTTMKTSYGTGNGRISQISFETKVDGLSMIYRFSVASNTQTIILEKKTS